MRRRAGGTARTLRQKVRARSIVLLRRCSGPVSAEPALWSILVQGRVPEEPPESGVVLMATGSRITAGSTKNPAVSLCSIRSSVLLCRHLIADRCNREGPAHDAGQIPYAVDMPQFRGYPASNHRDKPIVPQVGAPCLSVSGTSAHNDTGRPRAASVP